MRKRHSSCLCIWCQCLCCMFLWRLCIGTKVTERERERKTERVKERTKVSEREERKGKKGRLPGRMRLFPPGIPFSRCFLPSGILRFFSVIPLQGLEPLRSQFLPNLPGNIPFVHSHKVCPPGVLPSLLSFLSPFSDTFLSHFYFSFGFVSFLAMPFSYPFWFPLSFKKE